MSQGQCSAGGCVYARTVSQLWTGTAHVDRNLFSRCGNEEHSLQDTLVKHGPKRNHLYCIPQALFLAGSA